jgi:hypothetical protein
VLRDNTELKTISARVCSFGGRGSPETATLLFGMCDATINCMFLYDSELKTVSFGTGGMSQIKGITRRTIN